MNIEDKINLHNQLGKEIASHYAIEDNIVHRNLFTKIIKIEDCRANDYNPNKMPKKEMNLLWDCIEEFGFLFPDLAFFDGKKWIIIDGFHRLESLKRKGKKYLSIIDMSDLTLEQRVRLTVLMNRIKGMHQVELMSGLVVKLGALGVEDIKICEGLGMEAEEYLRLKQQLGIAHSFRNHEYSNSWEVSK